MLGPVRLRLTLLFVLLTSIVYLVTSSCGVLRFWIRMNNELDDEISTIATEATAHISYSSNGQPSLDMPPLTFRQHVSIQIYSPNGSLLQSVGNPGIPRLVKDSDEFVSARNVRYRIKTFPVSPQGTPTTAKAAGNSGFLEVQVSTQQRDIAIHNYIENMFLLAPFLLLGLAVAGSYFSRWAVRPIETAMMVLRQFLADASHELGTPLAVLRSTSDNLSIDVAGMPEAEERVETLTRTTERMAKLVADMAHLARLESAELSMDKQNLQLEVLVPEIVTTFRELAKEKNLTLSCDAQGATIKGDKAAIERLLVNLLQNAVRYTEDGGKIDVSVSVKDNSAVLSVQDTGVGIPADSLPYVFQRFYRVEKARSRAAGGSGLGLAIVKGTATAHGGSVSVVSEEGKGTKFTVVLPLVGRK
ncbi:MAG TPA: HAMP domain-containing sensor histidine kinase [Trichormus sp.]|jgi:signal transduction histidine kinase